MEGLQKEIQGMITRENNLISALKTLKNAYHMKLNEDTIICLSNEINKTDRVLSVLDEINERINIACESFE